MKREKCWLLYKLMCCAVTISFAVLLLIANASALDFMGGDLSLHGKFIAQVGVHLQDSQRGGPDFESGDLSMAQNLLDLEGSYSPSNTPLSFLRFSVIGRYFKEWAYQLSSAYESRYWETADPLIPSEGGVGFLDPYLWYSKEVNRNHPDWGEDLELREAFADIDLGDYGALRLGKQQITWGEADGIRLADIINPLNISRHFNLEAWEDLRIPIVAAYANLTHPAIHDFTFDIVFTGDYERAVRGEPGSNTTWAFPIPNAARGWNPFGPADLMPYFIYNEPDDWDNNYEYGARIRYKSPLAGMEFSAFYFHTTNDVPVLNWRGGFGLAPPPAPPIPILPIIYLEYLKYDNFGFTFNLFSNSLKTVFRGEFVYVKDQKFNRALPGFDALIPGPPSLQFDIVEADQYRGMVGFDRNVFIPFLNPTKSFFVSGQYFYLYQEDHEDLLDATYMDGRLEEATQVLTLKVNTAYMMERLAPDILIIVSPDDSWWQVQ